MSETPFHRCPECGYREPRSASATWMFVLLLVVMVVLGRAGWKRWVDYLPEKVQRVERELDDVRAAVLEGPPPPAIPLVQLPSPARSETRTTTIYKDGAGNIIAAVPVATPLCACPEAP